MIPTRPAGAALITLALAIPFLDTPASGTPTAGSVGVAVSPHAPIEGPQVVIDWQAIALRTIYTENAAPIPVGTLYLGFSSLAVDDAVSAALKRGHTSATAAAATAAHDVLATYFPTSSTALDADLTTTLAAVPDGPAQAKGIRIGRAAAAAVIADREDDGRNDASIIYSRPPAIGVWQPPAGGAMLAPWLGFVDFLTLTDRVPVDGPDALDSAEYTADYTEVRRMGSTGSTMRSQEQTDLARFFNVNVVVLYREALWRHLDEHPLSLDRTARLMARLDAATADTLIQCWRAKYDEGFWRPFQAIAGAEFDGNPDTAPEANWTALLPNPPYPDYNSGHGSITSAFAEVVRREFGEDTPLVLRNALGERSYSTLSALEHDALNSRIWGGLHFRDAMDDAYHTGHETARQVISSID